MTGLRVRRAEPADFPAVARLTVAAYEADGQLKGETGYAPVLADVAARAECGEVLVAVDEVTGEVAGAVTFVLPGTPYAELAGPGEAEFRMLAVDPAAQGRGAGAALVGACVARATELGCSAVVICVRSGMAAVAQRLYGRLGFVRAPEKDWTPLPGVELLGLRLDLTRPA
ncbi:GNAT family N-acetyltransferase [Micromonospora chaiyaphumensis]|uniref:Ribosomal protein S18 acetylase RimI n=1 Tax=Micromonospora chaiyaphumensis TaxID=307119 RepID=A0A1C4WLS8_9ACTN|nr:GNAT family N-acetyltransferase [Micromonospora chaiyaphumensis]SCE97172.1 Ribosomal protein S18 acetylase RimI [Micromonospora chaiyaphumensis]